MSTAVIEREIIQDALPVRLCPWLENPYGLVSLFRMLQVHAIQFKTLLDGLSHLEQCCADHNFDSEIFGPTLGAVNHDATKLELLSTLKQIERINYFLQTSKESALARGSQHVDLTPFTPMISELRVRVSEDLEESVFFHVSPSKARECFQRSSKEGFVEFTPKTPEEFFGVDVVKSFSSASFDIGQARHCFFTGCNTACVFHLMRVLEIGLTALGSVFVVSLAHTNWGPAIDKIESAIKNIPNDPAWKAQPDWKDQQEFYSQAASHFRVLKDAWRNYTAHARGKYDDQEALDMLGNVRGFMQKLATRLHE